MWSGYELPLLLQETIPASGEIEERDAERKIQIVGGRGTPDEPVPKFE